MNSRVSWNAFFEKKVYFRGAEVEFVSGKKVALHEMSSTFTNIPNGICLHAELDEYKADFIYTKIEKQIYCKAVLTPKTDRVKDKVRKITSLRVFGYYEQDALLIKQDFIDCGIEERGKKNKSQSSPFTLLFQSSSAITDRLNI